MAGKDAPVGFFDSGLGGISVLLEARKLLPSENYIYYGDSANAPYGIKSPERITELSEAAVEKLLSMGAKAVVIACNTATGEAVNYLRQRFEGIPIVGTEPAIKPAVSAFPGGRVLVMATPQCLESRRVRELAVRFENEAELVLLPCPGLMEFVERGEFTGERLNVHLKRLMEPVSDKPFDAVVLGCTHYPFLRESIARFSGSAAIIDGNLGISRQLMRRLDEAGLLREEGKEGSVRIENSSGDPVLLERSRIMLGLK
ncbi:MAG: glutamate racemase [Firmicutes bacterium]|nr:glutamate racemase [Bacillota bacterium]